MTNMDNLTDDFANVSRELLKYIPNDEIQKIKQNRRLEAMINELAEMDRALNNDILSLKSLINDPSIAQQVRRNTYRATFAYFEGIIYGIKQLILTARGSMHQVELNDAEITILSELRYHVNDRGKIREEKNNFIKLKANILFTYKTAAKAFQLNNFALDNSGKGWESFNRAIEVRNRVTHPKSITEIIISDEDMKNGAEAINWFSKEYQKFITFLQAKTQEILADSKSKNSAAYSAQIANSTSYIQHLSRVVQARESIELIAKESNLNKSDRDSINNAIEILREYQEHLISRNIADK